jgi:chaperonin GroEL
MEKVGKVGVITVKEGHTIKDEIEITEGIRFDRGFISPYFITDVKAQIEFEKPYILLSEKKIFLLQDILPSLEAAAQARQLFFIIAEDEDGDGFTRHRNPLLSASLTLAPNASAWGVFFFFFLVTDVLLCS